MTAERPPGGGARKRILFVDDEPEVLDSLRDGLRRYRDRWQLSFATSGAAALEILAAEPADVIVSDMKMPGMDGAELLERAKHAHPSAVRIVLSGYASAEVVARAATVAHRILAKPCDTSELCDVLARACALHDLTREAELFAATVGAAALPSRPSLYLELATAIEDDDAGPDAIASVIERDIAMTAKVLQLANSAFFGAGRSVSRVRDAVLYLGADTIKALALSIEAFGKLTPASRADSTTMEHFSRHAAVTARLAAEIAPADCQHDAVAAALLHDIGVLVLLQQDPGRWETLSALAGRQGRPVHEAERELGGTSHAKIGGYLLALWGLPQTIVEAVAYHHDPGSLPGRNLDAVAVVHIADALACEIGADLEGTRGHCSFDCEYVGQLGAIPHLDGWREEARTIAFHDGLVSR